MYRGGQTASFSYGRLVRSWNFFDTKTARRNEPVGCSCELSLMQSLSGCSQPAFWSDSWHHQGAFQRIFQDTADVGDGFQNVIFDLYCFTVINPHLVSLTVWFNPSAVCYKQISCVFPETVAVHELSRRKLRRWFTEEHLSSPLV